MKTAGYLLIILGLVLTAITIVTLFTGERIMDVGNIEISINKPHYFQWSPLVGVGIILCGGAVILLSPGKSK
jgi:hypothetical protein